MPKKRAGKSNLARFALCAHVGAKGILPKGLSPLWNPLKNEVSIVKNHRIYLRVSDAEKGIIALHAREHDMTISKYILHCALADEFAQANEDRQLMLELQRIGGNLNQIARKMNSGSPMLPLAGTLRVLAKKLDTYCEIIMQERKEYRDAVRNYYREWLNYLRKEFQLQCKLRCKEHQCNILRTELKRLQNYNSR